MSEGVKGVRSIKKAKKENPNGKPKRSDSAYFLYSAERREQVRDQYLKENGKFDTIRYTKDTGALWRKLDDTKKAKYG